MASQSLFKWRHFLPEIIVLNVRWYCRYALSYRDLEEMMAERGVEVDHSTINRWILSYAPELDKRVRPYLNPTNDSWRVDETYIEVKGEWKYLYRAVDSAGNTLDFMLSAKRDGKAAARFFRKVLKAPYTQKPRVITVDKNAVYPVAVEALKADETLAAETGLRQSKYMNNILIAGSPQHQALDQANDGFGSFNTARRTLSGIEAMSMIRKGQVKGISRGDSVSQVKFIEELLGISA
ncbi:MAG: IS6 family transposase [Leptolyngbya sp. Prado105]|nr:IS6 family transposase [Leptolyngbya sp. Prado105]